MDIALLHLVAADIADAAKEKERADVAREVEERRGSLVAAINGNDIAAMHDMTRRLTTIGYTKASPSITDENGTIVHGHVETKKRWRRHFASLMDGAQSTLAAVIEKSRSRTRRASVSLDIELVPTNADRARRMRRFNLKSGIGEDRIGTEILKLNAGAVSHCMAAITLKSCLQVDMPIQVKGGHIIELYKGKGSRLECGNFRDVTLGHVTSKPLAACLRHKAHLAFRRVALDTQFGALKSRGTDMAHLFVRASFDAAAATGQSIAGIFIDVEKAFARLCRALILPTPESDEIFISRLVGVGLSRQVVEAVLQKVRSFDAWGSAGSGALLGLLVGRAGGR